MSSLASGAVELCGLRGEFACPPHAKGLVVLSHGGSSGHGAGDGPLAQALHGQGMATLQLDLLMAHEATDSRAASDVAQCTQRVAAALDWLHQRGLGGPGERRGAQPVGLFGVGIAAVASLCAATARPGRVCAVVSRGGGVELIAAVAPAQLHPPTLLIVGGADLGALELNREAFRALRCEKRLEIVPGATQGFDEPGALDAAAQLAAHWFASHCKVRVGP
ncbi:MAG: alpha/beta hydrolase [Ideonella sp.]|nr:alpha/beta hydrolase [Ideonella sp.]MCC7457110.1 hypothetical protein [Nitrospira sp.]